MVTGIESFKEWFKGNESQYAIIGGTACDILMTEEGLDFRATKDIDNVLHIHGIYDSEKEIDNIIADKEQYDAVMNNQGAQFIQGILGTRRIITKGICGRVK